MYDMIKNDRSVLEKKQAIVKCLQVAGQPLYSYSLLQHPGIKDGIGKNREVSC